MTQVSWQTAGGVGHDVSVRRVLETAAVLGLALLLVALRVGQVAGVPASLPAALVLAFVAPGLLLWVTQAGNREYQVSLKAGGIWIAVAAVILVGEARACLAGILGVQEALQASAFWLLLTATTLLVSGFLQHPGNQRSLATTSLAVYVVANFASLLLGFLPSTAAIQSNEPNETLAAVGIGLNRVQFPLSGGVNAFGLCCGLLFVLAWRSLASGPVRHALVFLAGLGMLLADSRMAMLCAGLVTVFSFTGTTSRRLAPVLASTASVWGALLLVAALAAFGTEAVGARTAGGGELALSGRLELWRAGVAFLGDHPGVLFFGSGLYGHVASGLAAHEPAVFVLRQPIVLTRPLHNEALQLTFDYGLFAVAGFCWLLFRSVAHGILRFDARRQAAFGLAYVGLVGATEYAPNVYNPELLLSTLLLVSQAWLSDTGERA